MPKDLRGQIVDAFGEIYREHADTPDVPELEEDSVLLETGLDSLGLAILVIRLEEQLGFDPFVSSDEAYYPRTFGELVRFYEAHRPA